MRWTTRSCQLDARWLQVNFLVNYCFIRSHVWLKPTHCRSAGRQAINTHTLNSWERHFDQSLRLTAAMLDHHVQMSVFIACEQSWVYRRKYCFLSKIRRCTVINFIRSLACKRITMNPTACRRNFTSGSHVWSLEKSYSFHYRTVMGLIPHQKLKGRFA